jgi:hypothetical protein
MAKQTIDEVFAGVEWRPIEGYESEYAVSADGRVWSFRRSIILKPEEVHNGYLRVALCVDKEVKHYRIHRLVANAFLPNPLDLPQVNHINHNRKDNRVENLEWTTQLENLR